MGEISAMDIYKLLPQSNCGDCNLPTCMAFAMQVASKQASLDECPHVSDQAIEELAEASAPPIRKITIGKGDNQVEVGQETVLFRHEEKFYRPTGVAIKLQDNLSSQELQTDIAKVNDLEFERVGEVIGVNLLALEHTDSNPEQFASLVEVALSQSNCPLILISYDAEVMEEALRISGEDSPLIYGATEENWEKMSKLAHSYESPLVVIGSSLEELASNTQRIKEKGVENLVLAPEADGMNDHLEKLTTIRRAALEKEFKPLGYPVITRCTNKNPFQEVAQASTYILKYASLLVMEGIEKWEVLAPLTVRQHVYIDPQVNNSVEAKLYEVGEPGKDSPVLFTTNFSLTYFTVETEVANSGQPAYITVMDTDGLGILNAYADDQLSGETVAELIQKQGAMDKVDHNKLIIPGLVAVLRMSIQEEGGWEVLVGPEDAASIPRFLNKEWPELKG